MSLSSPAEGHRLPLIEGIISSALELVYGGYPLLQEKEPLEKKILGS